MSWPIEMRAQSRVKTGGFLLYKSDLILHLFYKAMARILILRRRTHTHARTRTLYCSDSHSFSR